MNSCWCILLTCADIHLFISARVISSILCANISSHCIVFMNHLLLYVSGLVATGEKPQKQTGGLVVTKDLMGEILRSITSLTHD